MLSDYDIVVGLEIHAELNTNTKVFCGCANAFGSAANTQCCPVCVGMPGALPFVNKQAIEKTIKAGIAMNGKINDVAVFERKNYFYPDLSKAYQISQLVRPIVVGGFIKLGAGKILHLNRIHLEEDAGKLIHDEVSGKTKVDYNRGGVPLIEIVTEPEFSSASEVVEFLEEIRSRLIFADVAECKMEEGGMRCDVNLSLKPKGSKTLGNRAEIKNLNSFKMVTRAIEFESCRQAELLDSGKKIVTETRKWDDNKGKTFSMRNKEQSQDYRYFPDPDIYAVEISSEDVSGIEAGMPVLAHELKEKFIKEYELPVYDADILTKKKETAKFYLECIACLDKPKKISNWIMVDLFKIMNDAGTEIFPITPLHLTEIIKMVEDKMINKTVGLQLMEKVMQSKRSPLELAKELGFLTTISEEQIAGLLTQLKTENPKVEADYKTDKDKVLKYIIGFVMKNTQGKAKSEIVEKLIPQIFG